MVIYPAFHPDRFAFPPTTTDAKPLVYFFFTSSAKLHL
jgi:hypothetical protein